MKSVNPWRVRAVRLMILLWGGILLTVPSAAGYPAGDIQSNVSPASLIPKSLGEEWISEGEPETYEGEDLFLYINGGAEIYHEYGFLRVAIRDFEDRDGHTISLEVFEMQNPDAAFGIYSFKTSSEGRELPIGEQARLEDYYLNVRKGSYLVTLTGFDEDEATIAGLAALAERVAAGIEAEPSRPEILSRLPGEGLLPESVKYFRGALGLYNSHRFFTGRTVFLREGARGDYRAGYSLFVLRYDSEEEAAAQWTALSEGFQEDPGYNGFTPGEDSEMRVSRAGGIRLRAVKRGADIVIALGPREAVESAVLFAGPDAR